MSKLIALSEAASIGIHAMVLIAQSDEMINVLKISEQTGASKHHVAKVLQRLVKEDFLDSSRGPLGGFTLKKNPEEVSLLEIYEAIEGPIEVKECPSDYMICPFDKCLTGNIINRMTMDFKEYLRKSTLNKFCNPKKLKAKPAK